MCRMFNLMDSISGGESRELEFKSELPSESTKWLKTIVAFANCSGGTLIIGVDDDRNIVGIPEDKAFILCDSIVSTVMSSCTPQISISPSVKRIDEKALVIVDVFPGNGRPYHISNLGIENGTFVRIGGTTRQADGFILKELHLQGSSRTFDTQINMDVQVTDERTKKICESLSELDRNAVTEKTLINSGIIAELDGRKLATNAYALLCDESPFRYTEIRCGSYKGTGGTEFIDRANYSCPIQDQIKNAYAFVKRNIRLGGRINGLYREDRYEIPLDAIRELIVNAIQHRSYIDPTRASYVAIYDDRIEITSPGGLPYSLNVDMMRQGRSAHRNPAISRVFRAAGYCEGWANGISFVFDECENYGLPQPLIENSGMDLRVTIYRPGFYKGTIYLDSGGIVGGNGGIVVNPETAKYGDSDALGEKNSDRMHILSALLDNPGMTVNDLVSSLGMPKRRVERYISDMKREGILMRTGSTRSGQWVVMVSKRN